MAKAKTGGINAGLAVPSAPDDTWQHEDNARTLMKAGEIMNDPDKMSGAMKHVRKQKKGIKSIMDMKKFRQQKYGAGGNPDMTVNDYDGDEG